jgi:peptide chain release factor 2
LARSFKIPGGIFDPEKIKRNIALLEEETLKSDFWQERKKAGEVLTRLKKNRSRLDPWSQLSSDFSELNDLFELALEENDQSLEAEITGNLIRLEERYSELNLLELLGGESDSCSAFLTIHSGAGGTEACDWVSMLLRMYSRWADQHGYKTEIIDLLEAEGGIKSVTTEVTGEYAYGYLKAESGIHRLVRISPFDSSSRRHTSFASVFCSPVIDETIEVDIRQEDLRIDTYRAAGAGGQHVNKTDSAVRITHLPTKIVVQCQNERSQFQNKAQAMKILRSRLYEHYLEQRENERAEREKEKKEISWGNQIRSYVFQPYTMVKDHRTNYETGNIQAVIDGALDPFMQEYLKQA